MPPGRATVAEVIGVARQRHCGGYVRQALRRSQDPQRPPALEMPGQEIPRCSRKIGTRRVAPYPCCIQTTSPRPHGHAPKIGCYAKEFDCTPAFPPAVWIKDVSGPTR